MSSTEVAYATGILRIRYEISGTQMGCGATRFSSLGLLLLAVLAYFIRDW